MATLSGQSISDTYDGLLKLEDSTTGITSTYQQIQDGLGNNTKTRISSVGIQSPTIIGMNNLKPDYAGNGFQAGAGTANTALTQNKVLYIPFYDPGVYSYSSITYSIGTLSTTSDVVTMAFYTMGQVPIIGASPKDLIMSGITLESVSPSTTGVKTTTLPSTLSFSGTGGGFYMAAFYVSNSGVTPTIRYGGGNITANNQSYAYNLGFYLTVAGTATNIGQRFPVGFGAAAGVLNLSFQPSYTSAEITSNVSSTISNSAWGFGLKPI
jgi:hypothetical protein